MGPDAPQSVASPPRFLNFGCGYSKIHSAHGIEWVNADLYGNPDVRWDLNVTPYPWPDEHFDGIVAHHVFEHLEDWWGAFKECARVLKPGGFLDFRVPDESSSSALCYRDHRHVFGLWSFHGTRGFTHGANAWAVDEQDTVPLQLVRYTKVPFEDYQWLARWLPRVFNFCAAHLRNFVWEQQFEFRKIGDKHGQ